MTQAAARPLASAWTEAKEADPFARARDVAARLGVSEGALAEARRGAGVMRLRGEGEALSRLVTALPRLGRVMTLTRNDAAVHETKGRAGETAGMGAIGQVTGEIDLRLFYRCWRAAYEVAEETRSGLRRSIQIFDGAGDSILKIFALEGADTDAWARLVRAEADPDAPPLTYMPAEPEAGDRPDAEIDLEALRAGWRALDHSHDFHGLLRRTGAGREQALRLAGPEFARPAGPEAARRMLEAAAGHVPIMCFAGNPGCIQIFSGEVNKIKMMGPWLNVLDEAFNLHLRTDLVASTWLVTKPTKQRGPITSLELFDARGRLACQFFGVRPAGGVEREDWRRIAHAAAEGAA
ncbi:MAG: hemin-degrading factor [Pikeienuella sp.]|uniref:hemin-degrading factor n=1 Tax=Pikeienuella sp. TaxID=2831957 RepID=UPI00391CA755